jgi:hypothetical protein
MPEDFYEFWEFCCHLNSKKPRGNTVSEWVIVI